MRTVGVYSFNQGRDEITHRYPHLLTEINAAIAAEVQFGKYAFMVYNVCAKMTIFKKLGHIDCGVEIVPVKGFADEMSTGVSYFEQFIWTWRRAAWPISTSLS